MRSTRIFSDLDLNFTRHPVTNDVSRRFNEDAVKRSLRNLILTSNFERPFHSEIGTPIKKLLFETATPLLGVVLKRAIIDAVTNFEPRVQIINVTVRVNEDGHSVDVTLEFNILNTLAPLSLELTLQRTR